MHANWETDVDRYANVTAHPKAKVYRSQLARIRNDTDMAPYALDRAWSKVKIAVNAICADCKVTPNQARYLLGVQDSFMNYGSSAARASLNKASKS